MSGETDLGELIDPDAHEPVTDAVWDADRARAAVAAIVSETEASFDPNDLWPPHPLDEDEDEPPLGRVASLYLGAAGVIWALHALERAGLVEARRDWGEVALTLHDRYRAEPDFPAVGVVPSLWMGEAGILLVAHTLAPAAWQEEHLLDVVRRNADNPSLELNWGSPGTMLAAAVMFERTREERWKAAWTESADRLWSEWRGDLWEQDLYGKRAHILGPAHGFAGNVFVLGRGDLLDGERRAALGTRAATTLDRHALRSDGVAQWRPSVEPSRVPRRTQWCHGAPGIVASLGSLAPGNDALSELLLAGGELTWRAGPLRKGANLCHGTAGNGYAFLKL
ncbi:MAG TPA: lanthionine synthetase LanC family protein, partial [Gaiella sp.]|nr:lanthionine synthetase LanC family protein [Gaiella sp.]